MTTIVAGFTTQGEPALGLSPTIRIRRTDTQALVVTDAAMTEQGDGMYSYDFAQDPTLKYAIRSDGTDVLPTVERYVFGSLGAIEDVDLATSAVNKIRDTILADSTPFNGANIDAAISSRGTADPGDAMDLIPNAVDAAAVATDAIDADALATDAVNEVRDAILSDSTPFDGADIAAILNDTGITIPALIAGIASDVWDELASSHQVIGRMGAIYTRLIGKFITNPSTGVNTIRDLGDTGDFVTADIFEDVAESQQYQDQGINVRDEYT